MTGLRTQALGSASPEPRAILLSQKVSVDDHKETAALLNLLVCSGTTFYSMIIVVECCIFESLPTVTV